MSCVIISPPKPRIFFLIIRYVAKLLLMASKHQIVLHFFCLKEMSKKTKFVEKEYSLN